MYPSTGLTVKKWWCNVSVLCVNYLIKHAKNSQKMAKTPYSGSICGHTACFKIDTVLKFKKNYERSKFRHIKNDNTAMIFLDWLAIFTGPIFTILWPSLLPLMLLCGKMLKRQILYRLLKSVSMGQEEKHLYECFNKIWPPMSIYDKKL